MRPDDLSGAGWERYHDGSGWTADVRPVGALTGARRRVARWSLRTRVASGVAGALLAGTAGYAGANWAVNLAAGQTTGGEGLAASDNGLNILAVAVPTAANALLFPGSTGDVLLTISNSNTFPVTITAITVPTNTTFASAYSNSGLSTASAACSPSDVYWSAAASASTTTSHTLATAINIAAGTSGTPATYAVTLTGAAAMQLTSPSGCASQYFSMPALSAVTATSAAPGTTTSTAPTDS